VLATISTIIKPAVTAEIALGVIWKITWDNCP
jgi:hypothetical protein